MDLSNLIDKELLQTFGRGTIVPIAGAVATLAGVIEAMSEKMEQTENSGITGSMALGIESDLAEVVFQLELQNLLDVSGLNCIVVNTFDSEEAGNLVSGIYSEGKVCI